MKRIIACAGAMVLVSGIAISETPNSQDSLMESSDLRDTGGETRAFWQYQFGHAKQEINGLRYGLRYEQSLPYSNGEWRAPMMEFVRNVNDPLMPFELNVSGMNLLAQNYQLNAGDGVLFGLSWAQIGTMGVILGATAYAVSSAEDGDSPPKREPAPDESGGDDSSVGDVVGGVVGGDDSSVGGVTGLAVTSSAGLIRSGGHGYIPNEPLAPHEVEAMHTSK